MLVGLLAPACAAVKLAESQAAVSDERQSNAISDASSEALSFRLAGAAAA